MIRCCKHFVKNTETGKKCRVYYCLDNHASGKKCVIMHAKGYADFLDEVFDRVENNTDTMTDYFEKDRVIIFEGDEGYEEIRLQVEKIVRGA